MIQLPRGLSGAAEEAKKVLPASAWTFHYCRNCQDLHRTEDAQGVEGGYVADENFGVLESELVEATAGQVVVQWTGHEQGIR